MSNSLSLRYTELPGFAGGLGAGAALLGWIAGQLIGEDPVSLPYIQHLADQYVYGPIGKQAVTYKVAEYSVQVACTLFVVLVGWLLMKWRGRRRPEPVEQKGAAE